MNITNGAEITLIKSTSVLHGKIKVGDFITKVDGTPVERPNDLFLIRGPISHFRTFLDGFIKIAVQHTPPSDIAAIDSISLMSENDVLCGRGKHSDLGNRAYKTFSLHILANIIRLQGKVSQV